MGADRLSKNVNSDYQEHSPVLSPDGKRLYFSRQFHPDNVGGVDDQEDIWVSEMDEETGEWLPAKNAGEPLNTAGPNFISVALGFEPVKSFLLKSITCEQMVSFRSFCLPGALKGI